MSPLVAGPRISRGAALSVATSAVIVDDDGRVLLTRRRDTGLWCLPGGIMGSGESIREAVRREVLEETGLDVEVVHLVGVYSDPDLVVAYEDGRRYQPIVLCFRCALTGGSLRTSDETSDHGYHSLDALPPLVEAHRQRLLDVRSGSVAASIR